MITLVAANSNGLMHFLAGRYPGKIGWMMSPATKFIEPRGWMPYAIDNGKFSQRETWNEAEFFKLLDRCRLSKYKPLWIAVPDEVSDKKRTLYLWNQYEHKIRQYGWPYAFVVQDGMTLIDVPKSADVIFIGGSTTWKWRNTAMFAAAFPRIHVGRVNWVHKLEFCERLGVESCDGSGFFRGDMKQQQQLVDFISGHRRHKEQFQLF